MGIEPTSSAWEAEVLPLNYTRQMLSCSESTVMRRSESRLNHQDVMIIYSSAKQASQYGVSPNASAKKSIRLRTRAGKRCICG
jgi:hypothetical protein